MKFRRRQYLIHAGLQVRSAVSFIIIALIGNVCSVAVFNVYALKKLDDLRWSTHLDIGSAGEVLTPLFLAVNGAMIVFMAIVLVIFGIRMIRKASGAIYRMTTDIDEFARGHISANIRLREDDEFHDVARQLQDMMNALRGEFVSIREQYHNVSLSVSSLRTAVEAEDTSTCDRLFHDLAELESRLKKFQT